jgi:repressor LexA
MSNFSENLRRIRFERHMTQEEFAQLLGTNKQNISRYESGAVSPKIGTAQKIADKLGISLSELNGSKEPIDLFRINDGKFQSFNHVLANLPANVRPMSALPVQRVPLIGAVAAGEPIYAPEELGVYVDTPVQCDAAITIQGDSMVPNYLDGDVVYIKCRPDVSDGAVAVVFLDDEATLKHVYKRETGLTLISDNPAHAPMMIEFEDYARVRVFGVPVGYTRMFKADVSGKVRKGFPKQK